MGTGILGNEVKEWLVETLPYEVVWLDRQGNILYANERFRERLGYKTTELQRLSVYDFNPSVTNESWDDHWEFVKREKTDHFKATHKSKSGKFYQVEVFTRFFSNNGIDLICGVINDVTEPNFYRQLVDNTETIAKVGGWTLNLQDGFLKATKEALRIFDVEDSENLAPAQIIHYFKEPEKLKGLMRGVMRDTSSYDEVLETTDSRFIRAVAKPILKGDKIYKIIGVYQDVTEQYARENDLQFFKEIIDNAEDLIYIYNRSGDLVYYSKSVIKNLGFSKKQLDAFSIFDLDLGLDREWWAKHFDEIVEKGLLRFERMAIRKDGTRFPIDVSASHLRYNNEDYNCAVVRDITKKKIRDLELYEALEEIRSLKERLENENEYLQEEISSKINFNNIICKSEAYKSVLRQVDQVAPTQTTVLITGESGTGKELLASAVHSNSARKNRPLIKINCATLPQELIESELFGHKKGAFTGAVADKVGKFTLANGGTIFLDEIGELPLELQPKLLRVLQEGEYDELGGTKTIKIDVRIIAATNRDLKEMIREGQFREDLYYRLNVFPIYNIPLRARKDDIPLLAQFFLEKYSAKAGKSFKRLATKTIESLMNYNFPGNIRELQNLIERAVILESGTILTPGNWIPDEEVTIHATDFKSFEEKQKEYIVEVLDQTNWRVSGPNGAAAILMMNDKTLFAKMKRLGIEKKIGLKS